MPKKKTGVSALDPNKGKTVSVVGDTYTVLIGGSRNGGKFAVIDMLVPPGGGPGPHSHAKIQESFYVVAGEVVVRSKGMKYTARKGSFVNIPTGGAVHEFKNTSRSTAHLLCLVVPAGLDAFFLDIGKPVAPGSFLPPPRLEKRDLKRLEATARSYGQRLFPPDYLD